MPKALISKVQSEYEAKGKSPKEAASIAYGTMNNRGYMHGSTETAAGASAEAKYESDHGRGGKRKNVPPSIAGLHKAMAKSKAKSAPDTDGDGY